MQTGLENSVTVSLCITKASDVIHGAIVGAKCGSTISEAASWDCHTLQCVEFTENGIINEHLV